MFAKSVNVMFNCNGFTTEIIRSTYTVVFVFLSLNVTLVFCLLSTPMGVDYIVIGFDMEVQPLVTHNAA